MKALRAHFIALAMLGVAGEARADLTFEASPTLPNPHHLQSFVPATWPVFYDEEDFPLTLVFTGSLPEGISLEDLTRAVNASIQTWNAVPCTTARIEFGGTRTTLEEVDPEREHALYFASTTPDEIPDAKIIGQLIWRTPERPTFRIRLNDLAHRWDTRPHPFQRVDDLEPGSTRVDLQAVLTHELGHLLGLDHIRSNRTAAMWGTYSVDGGQRVLSAADKLSLCAMHPANGASECSEDRECGPGASCFAHQVGTVCEKELGSIGDYCALDLLYCPEVCHLDSRAGTGYCTETCASDDDCPALYACMQSDDQSLGQRCILSPPRRNDQGGCTLIPTSPAPPRHLGITLLLVLAAFAGWTRRHLERP